MDHKPDAESTREWFASFRSIAWWLRYKNIPNDLFQALDDDRSVRLANRRYIRWVALPILLTIMFVFGTQFLQVDYEVDCTYYSGVGANRKVECHTVSSDWKRPFGHYPIFNMTCDVPFEYKQYPLETSRTLSGISLVIPAYVNRLTIIVGLVPVLALILGVFPNYLILQNRYSQRFRDCPDSRSARSARATLSLIAQAFGLSLWIWFLAAGIEILRTLTLPGNILHYVSMAGFALAIVFWTLASLMVLPVMAGADRERVMFGPGDRTPLLTSGLSIAGLVGVIFLVIEFGPTRWAL